MFVCPYPDCNHIGLFISKVHCRTHGMEQEVLFETYGIPEAISKSAQTVSPKNKKKLEFQKKVDRSLALHKTNNYTIEEICKIVKISQTAFYRHLRKKKTGYL